MSTSGPDSLDNGEDTENVVDPALLQFLLDPNSYGQSGETVKLIESHMSLVFLIGDRVYKMKKPIRLDLLNNLELSQRLENCRREFTLNQAVSKDIYLDVTPVTEDERGKLSIGGTGKPIEWLVVMRRLDEDRLLDHAIPEGRVTRQQIVELTAVLGTFYRRSEKIQLSRSDVMARWSSLMDKNENSLRTPVFALPSSLVAKVTASLRSFLEKNNALILARANEGWIRDGHGDLRPEHVYLGPPIRLIDRLEFCDFLRWHDPFEEIADLGMECERMGAPWIYPLLQEGLSAELGGAPEPQLMDFYAGARACVRARLAIEHLRSGFEEAEKWQLRAGDCLRIAEKYVCRQL